MRRYKVDGAIHWEEALQSNGLITPSILGGVAQRSRRPVIIATPKRGTSALAGIIGDPMLRVVPSATNTGMSHCAGITLLTKPELGDGYFAHQWLTFLTTQHLMASEIACGD